MRQTIWCVLMSVMLSVATETQAVGEEPPTNPVSSKKNSTAVIASFIQKQCIECHSADSPEGGLDLSSISKSAPAQNDFDIWVKVHDRVVAGEMPPKDELSKEQIQILSYD